MDKQLLASTVWLGVVEDNADPNKRGRARVRVPYVHADMPRELLPWASAVTDPNGTSHVKPAVGKVVAVRFNEGNIYAPEYLSAAHLNVNLQEKLQGLEGDDYANFAALYFDHATQLYRDNERGLVLDHEYSNINLDNDGNIMQNLRDNQSKMFVGTEDADQPAIMSTYLFDWLGRLMDCLQAGGFIGNLGAPTVANPQLIALVAEFKAKVNPVFQSKHVFFVDNMAVKAQKRPYTNQVGDAYGMTNESKPPTVFPSPYEPEDRPETGRPDINSKEAPPSDFKDAIKEPEQTIQSPPVSGQYENGRLPLDKLKKSARLSRNLGGSAAYLVAEATDALEAMMAAYDSASFPGKQKITFTDGYRTYERSQALYEKYGPGQAAPPGRGNHGWATAVDMYWGVRTAMHYDNDARAAGYRHPVFKWFVENGPTYGWYSPKLLNDDFRMEEWWHWEYHGKKGPHPPVGARYRGAFTDKDIADIKRHGGTYRA